MVFFFHFILDFFFTSAIHKIDGMYLVIRHQMLVSMYVLESSSANVVYRQMSYSCHIRSVEIVVELGIFVFFLIFSWKKSDCK